jgi:hypothetical protein
MQRRRKPRTLSRVADITGLPRHPIRYHVERGRIPIRHQPNQVHSSGWVVARGAHAFYAEGTTTFG